MSNYDKLLIPLKAYQCYGAYEPDVCKRAPSFSETMFAMHEGNTAVQRGNVKWFDVPPGYSAHCE